jgi:hypothetical protein
MRRPLLLALVALATALSLLAPPSSSAGRATSSLTIGPEIFVGGQSLTFTGTLDGAPGTRLQLQTLFNRAGDSWSTMEGFVGTTDADGDFAFEHPGPNNYGISYRVRAVNGATSPAVFLEPRQQEVVLSLDGGEAQEPGHVVTGESFTIDVDTTPTGRGTLGRPAPAFPGRGIRLQQRDGLAWRTVAATTSSDTGAARFTVTAGAAGPTAYRVVLDDVTTGGDEIGWFPSFPLLVTVVATAAELPAPPTGPVPPREPPVSSTPGSGRATPLASQRYRWGPPLFDFAWEGGESLTDRPDRGTRRTGRWIDTSDGSGRVAHYNGGMALSSHVSEFPGDGDVGTTTATLEGNAMTYGRWEFRRRIDVFENTDADHRITIELVPADPADARCGANVVTVADVTFDASTATLGLSSERAGRSWSGSRPIPRLGDGPHTFGVEVTRRNVTWFLDGKSLATVKGQQVAPGVPLTPRLSLVGRGREEMRRTRVLYDWQRGWELNRQARRAEVGPSLTAASLRRGAC